MRTLTKLPKPKILENNAAEWTKLYCDCLVSNKTPDKDLATKYNQPDIKRILEKETHEKCAYCESKIKHNSFGDIEHILPKNKNARPDLYVEWSNLTLSCEICNRSGKGTYYDPKLLLINPYDDNPESHFQALGPLIYGVKSDDRAFITEKTLKLNRSALVNQRSDRIDAVNNLLRTWENEKNTVIKNVLEKQLHEEYSEDKEYSFIIKGFLSARGFPII